MPTVVPQESLQQAKKGPAFRHCFCGDSWDMDWLLALAPRIAREGCSENLLVTTAPMWLPHWMGTARQSPSLPHGWEEVALQQLPLRPL